jgi:hypothetical protein
MENALNFNKSGGAGSGGRFDLDFESLKCDEELPAKEQIQ